MASKLKIAASVILPEMACTYVMLTISRCATACFVFAEDTAYTLQELTDILSTTGFPVVNGAEDWDLAAMHGISV